MKLLHFADAHIDMANYGRHDPATGLPLRVLDFLKSLDTIIETAIHERVDLVIFAGDAYKDRTPAPTFQREWGKRIMRLSQAKIPTILLVGNHDVSPSAWRAHAIQEFDTLGVPYVHVIAEPSFLRAEQLGLPVQVIGLPWVSRSRLMAALDVDAEQAYLQSENLLAQLVEQYIQEADPTLPLILTAHASVQGATYGAERMVMLGADVVLPGALVKDPRLDYVALGHIHKAQNLNEAAHPPVIYPGSIERVDFGEAHEEKFFIVADVQKGKTHVEWRKLKDVRPFVEVSLRLEKPENIMQRIHSALPAPEQLKDAIVKLTLEYPRDYETLIDEAALRRYASEAFEFHLVKRPQIAARTRLAQSEAIATLTPLELLDAYWKTNHIEPAEAAALNALAADILQEPTEPENQGTAHP